MWSDRDFYRLCRSDGELFIEPYDRSRIHPSSIDLTLHNEFKVMMPRTSRFGIALATDPYLEYDDLFNHEVIAEGSAFRLYPGAFVLASTVETVGLGLSIAAQVEGKALALDTPVPTPSGWTTMGELCVGDEVLNADGQPVAVVAVTEPFWGHCYRLIFDDRTEVVADENHLWRTWDRSARRSQHRQGRVKSAVRSTKQVADTLLVGREGGRNHAIDVVSVDLKEADLPIDPYVLGAWLGDGTTKAATLTAHPQDAQHFITEFQRSNVALVHRGRMLYSIGVKDRTRDNKGRYGANGSFHCSLRDLGVLNNKHIPATYLRGSLDQRWALLQGLMDTDGCMSARGDQAQITLTKEALARDVAELIASLGIKVWRDERPAMLDGRQFGTAYRMRFRPSDGMRVFRMARKQSRIKLARTQGSELRRRFIRSADRTVTQRVRCIQVDSEDGMFLVTRSFIPTHNSSLGRLGLVVHSTAGFIDPGFKGPITLELSNVGVNPIMLWPGMPIAQLVVNELTSRSSGYKGKYQGQTGPTTSKFYLNPRP